MVALLIIGLPFAVIGLIIAIICRGSYPRYIASGLALIIVVAFKFAFGSLKLTVEELFSGLLWWAIGSTLMSLTYANAKAALGIKSSPSVEREGS